MKKHANQLRTEIIINASPEKIWNCLMDFKSYPDWNPFIVSISGHQKPGSRLMVRLQPPDKQGMTIQPKVLVNSPEKMFSWMGHLFFPGLFDGEHIFEIHDNGNGSCTFVQRENFDGILVPLFKKMLEINTRQGFERMNESLKRRCEK